METPLILNCKVSATNIGRWRKVFHVFVVAGIIKCLWYKPPNPTLGWKASNYRLPLEESLRNEKDTAEGSLLNNKDTSEEDKDDGGEEDCGGKKEDSPKGNKGGNGKEEKVDDCEDKPLIEKGVQNSTVSSVKAVESSSLAASNSDVSTSVSSPYVIEESGKEENTNYNGIQSENSNAPSSLIPPPEAERNTDEFNFIPSGQVDESSSLSSANGTGEGDLENGALDRTFQHQHSDVLQGRVETSTSEHSIRAAFHKFLSFLPTVLNVSLETCQAALAQLAADHKIGHRIYLILSIIIAFVCLLVSFFEAIDHSAQSSGVAWRLLWTFVLCIGTICTVLQLIINLIDLLAHKNVIKFETMPLFLAWGHFMTTLIGRVRSNSSGASQVQTNLTTDQENASQADTGYSSNNVNCYYCCWPLCEAESSV